MTSGTDVRSPLDGPAAPLRCTTQTAIAVTENLTDLPMKKSHINTSVYTSSTSCF